MKNFKLKICTSKINFKFRSIFKLIVKNRNAQKTWSLKTLHLNTRVSGCYRLLDIFLFGCWFLLIFNCCRRPSHLVTKSYTVIMCSMICHFSFCRRFLELFIDSLISTSTQLIHLVDWKHKY